MNRRTAAILAALSLSAFAGIAQKSQEKKTAAPGAQPAVELAGSMAQRLSQEMHVKTVVGEPIKADAVTVIPILTLDVSFGGIGRDGAETDGFLMSGEARPVGFVVAGKKGTRFISAGAGRAR